MSEPAANATAQRLLKLYLARTQDHAVICIDPAGQVLCRVEARAKIVMFCFPSERPLKCHNRNYVKASPSRK